MSRQLKDLLSLESRYNELANTVEYLLLSQLNSQMSLESGVISNTKLRNLFFELIKQLNPTIFCDIGSRDGESSITVKEILPSCKCYAFEANPEIHAKFKDDPRLSQISFLNLAMSDRTGTVKVFAPRTLSKAMVGEELVDMSIIEPEDTGKTSLLLRNESATYTEFDVPAYALDDFWATENIALQNHSLALWIDVEGAADQVLQGTTKTLEHTAMILIEVENYSFWENQKKCHQIAESLISKGFLPVARDREYSDKQFNILFVHLEKIRTVHWSLFGVNSAINHLKTANDIQSLQSQLNTVAHQPIRLVRPVATFSSVEMQLQGEIPIYIPCFNNLTYVENMVNQLRALGCHKLIILNNQSTFPPLVEYLEALKSTATVIDLDCNQGPRHLLESSLAFSMLPNYFCLTDPDLQLNPELPKDFLVKLVQLTEELKVGKAGFSLDISDSSEMRQEKFTIAGQSYHIWDWEQQFWQQPIQSSTQESPVYQAAIDTTFALYNKKYFDPNSLFNAVRVAGNFTCKHLPWYQNNHLPPQEEAFYRETSQFSYYFRSKSKSEPYAGT
jgi:FkbM family methyltransferase